MERQERDGPMHAATKVREGGRSCTFTHAVHRARCEGGQRRLEREKGN